MVLQPACAAESDTSAGDSDGLLVCSAAQQSLLWDGVQSPSALPKSSASPVAQHSMTGVIEHEQSTSAVVPVFEPALQANTAQATDQGQPTTALVPVLKTATQLGSPVATRQHGLDSTMLAASVKSLFSCSHRWALAQHSALASGPQLLKTLMVYADSASADAAALSISTTSQLEIRSRDNMTAIAGPLYSSVGWTQALRHALASAPQLTTALAVYADLADTGWGVGTTPCDAVGHLGESARSHVAACCGRGRCEGAGTPAVTQLGLSSYSMSIVEGKIAGLPAL